MDLGNPDDEVRKNAVDTFKKCLKFNQILGASIVGTETAYPRLSLEEKKIWHPYMMDSVARLVEEAERLDVDMALEPVYWHPLEDLETTVEVFEKMNSNRLKMIFDPANVLEFPEIDQNAYWKEWLGALGHKIEAIHMKDFVEGPNKEYCPVCLGEGVIRYGGNRKMDEAAQTGYCRCQRGTGSKDGAEGYCVYEKVVDGIKM